MTVPLTGAGALFTRLGHLYGGMLDVLALRGGAATARVLTGANFPSRMIATVDPDYANGTALPQVIDGDLAALTSFQSSMGVILTSFKTYVQNTIVAMV